MAYSSGLMSITTSAPLQIVQVTRNSNENNSGNCVVMSSSDGSGDLITPETELLIAKLKSAVVTPLLFLFAGPTNVLNMIIFFTQGLRDRVNLCLFSLAIVDFCVVFFYFVIYIEQLFMFTSPDTYGMVFQTLVNNKILILYGAGYGSILLSVIIAIERCVCVLFPLRAKLLLKTKNMAIIILTGVPLVSFLRLCVLAKYVLVCFFDKRTKITNMGLYTTEYATRNKQLLDFVDGIFYGFIMAVACPIIVLIATVITSIRLLQTVAWRKQTSTSNAQKEVTVTKMLIMLSIEFLTFILPRVLLRIYPLFNGEFSAKGKYRYFYLACVSIGEMFVCMGSSFSFLVYYFTSTKFRYICRSLCSRQQGQEKGDSETKQMRCEEGFIPSRTAETLY